MSKITYEDRCVSEKKSRDIRHYRKTIKKEQAFSVWEVDMVYLRSGFIAAAVDRISKKIMAMPIPALFVTAVNVSFRNRQRFLNTRVYACDPGPPWQKGLAESTIRQLRCTFGRKTNYENITNKDVYKEAARLNNMRLPKWNHQQPSLLSKFS